MLPQCSHTAWVKVFYASRELRQELGKKVLRTRCLGLDFYFHHNVSEADGGLGFFSPRFLNKQLRGYHYFSPTSGIHITPNHPCESLPSPATKWAPAAPIVTSLNLQLCAVLTYPNWSPLCDSRVIGSVSRCQHRNCNWATVVEWMQAQHLCKGTCGGKKNPEKRESSNCILRTERTLLPLDKKICNVSVFHDLTKKQSDNVS